MKRRMQGLASRDRTPTTRRDLPSNWALLLDVWVIVGRGVLVGLGVDVGGGQGGGVPRLGRLVAAGLFCAGRFTSGDLVQVVVG